MCIATVFHVDNDKNEKLFEDIVSLEFDIYNDNISFVNILGEKQTLKAKVKKIDFLKHTIDVITA